VTIETDLGQGPEGPGPSIRAGQAEGNVLPDPTPGQEPGFLKDHGPAGRDHDPAPVGVVEAAQGAQQGGLAATALAQQGHELAGRMLRSSWSMTVRSP